MNPPNDIEIQSITAEIDIPPNVPAPLTETVPGDKVYSLEKDKFEHKKIIDLWGFRLLVAVIVLYFVMYIVEKTTGSEEMSKFTATISETLKFLISSLIGYLFASRPQ